ncbi:MAG: protein translocase subunit SecD [Clostridiales Family XIII bacterium]|jgi:SecD/SecF fusion protein|nr:protein translocase subunit SecD [Clostridiales Family XIII bacterium]
MKKIAAVITVVIIAFVWFLTVIGIGPVGPIQDKIKLGLDISGGVYVVMEAQTDKTGSQLSDLMEQTKAIIEQRVNEMGLSEPIATVEGENRIRVELPGAEDPEAAIRMIGQTAQLQFLDANGKLILDGSQVSDSRVQQDQTHGGYEVTLEFNSEGAEAFYQATLAASSGTVLGPYMEGVTSGDQIAIVLDGAILSAPSADSAISGGSAVITRPSGFTQDSAIELSTLIRGGALPVELSEVESSAIGATLGMGALTNSLIGGIIGVILILILMIVMYRFMGIGANLALLLYIPLIPWVIVLLGGVLTLPGIAGVILSIGMAVDANVIIFARVKEEVAAGKTLRVATRTGFRKAIGTILDSQVTTLIAGIVLYQMGTGPVRGFALTLIIGILLSLFTALLITNLFVRAFSESAFLVRKGLLGVREGGGVQGTLLKRRFSFVKNRRIYYIVTIVILVVGFAVGGVRGFNLGIDFTGGTMLQLDLGKEVAVDDVRNTLDKNDITGADIVHFGDQNEGVIIKTTQALTSDDRASIMEDFKADFGIGDDALQTFEQFGPSIGKMLTTNAIKAVLFAALFMLIYIVIRFRFRFGVAAIITTFHDVAITIAMYGLFHMTVNNPFIAAILTVVGYSINDTIVIFDRIRENLGLMKRQPLAEIIDTGVNQTLVRSLMTSLTTILAILPLVFIGGETIRQFAVPLIIGIAAGACSSIFIASPLYYEFAKGSWRGGTGRYKGAAAGTKALGAEARAPETALDEGGTAGADADGAGKPAGRNAGGAKGTSKKSKSKRRKDNGAVV